MVGDVVLAVVLVVAAVDGGGVDAATEDPDEEADELRPEGCVPPHPASTSSGRMNVTAILSR